MSSLLGRETKARLSKSKVKNVLSSSCDVFGITHYEFVFPIQKKLLLALSSKVILGSESHGTHDHILLSDGSGILKQVRILPSSFGKAYTVEDHIIRDLILATPIPIQHFH
jgi:hypothetical protein